MKSPLHCDVSYSLLIILGIFLLSDIQQKVALSEKNFEKNHFCPLRIICPTNRPLMQVKLL